MKQHASKYNMLLATIIHLQVRFVEQQVLRTMVKKGYEVPTDPNWPKQWFLVSYMEHLPLGLEYKMEERQKNVKGVAQL